MNTQNFVFAFTSYDDANKAHYFGVREDGSLYHSIDWATFHKIVGLYCTDNILQCGASYLKNTDQSIYRNKSYARPFVYVLSNTYLTWLDAGGIKPSIENTYKFVDFIPLSDISYSSESIDPEIRYYANYVTCLEHD